MTLSPLMSLLSLPFLLEPASPLHELQEVLHLPHEQLGPLTSNLRQLGWVCRALKPGQARCASLRVASRSLLRSPSSLVQLRFFYRTFSFNARACVQRQLTATKRKNEEVDPLDLGDDDMDIEYDKMDNLREMLAKSSVAITFQVMSSKSSEFFLQLFYLWVFLFLPKSRSLFHMKFLELHMVEQCK